MTALSAARATITKPGGKLKRLPMAASTTIYAGGMVMRNADGKAVPAAAGVSNRGVFGIATETKVSDGSTQSYILVRYDVVAKLVGSGLALADEGQMVYAADDQTVQSANGANLPIAGQLIEYISSTAGWVGVGPSFYRLNSRPVVLKTFPLLLETIANGDLLTGYTPGFVGFVEKFWAEVTAPATTAAKASTLNLEIGSTNLTGGVLSLTSANMTPLGAIVAATDITAANEFDADDTISIEAASTTAFVEGSVNLVIQMRMR